jgi:hypothetical protein
MRELQKQNPHSVVLKTSKLVELKRQIFHERNNTSNGDAQTCFLIVLPLSRYVSQDIRVPHNSSICVLHDSSASFFCAFLGRSYADILLRTVCMRQHWQLSQYYSHSHTYMTRGLKSRNSPLLDNGSLTHFSVTSRNSPLLDNGSLTHFSVTSLNNPLLGNGSVSKFPVQRRNTEKQNNRGTVRYGDLYSVRLEVSSVQESSFVTRHKRRRRHSQSSKEWSES